jgi:predicted MPP superfamily phosphohydrolase
MKAIWLTDIHLEFLDAFKLEAFLKKLAGHEPECVLISGDIGQAGSVVSFLSLMDRALGVEVFFVLGNHDYYNGSIAEVRAAVGDLCKRSSNLRWINQCGVAALTPTVCLVGHDGWGDARLGDFEHSGVQLNDFLLISELSGLSRAELRRRLNQLGDEAAAHFSAVLPRALRSANHVVVLTHVPPFIESSWYAGKHSDSDWLPFFACKAVGDVLSETMQLHPDKQMTVLCGHTHGCGNSAILPNLRTFTGSASYGNPIIQKVFQWE